jgi:glycosyltransferase involved in cell wall biosynthesis
MSRTNTTVIVNWRDRSHPQAGGAEIYCEEVAHRLAQGGRHVVLLTSAVSGRPCSERRNGFLVIRRGGPFTVYLHAFAWMWMHRRQIVEVIDAQCGIPFFAPLAVRRKTSVIVLIYHVHQQQFGQYLPPLLALCARWIEGPVARLVFGQRTIVTISPSSRRDIRRTLGFRGDIHIAVPGGVDVGTNPGSISGRSTTPRVVFVGRLVPHKRPHLAVKAFAQVVGRLPEAELHIVGDGPERPVLEELAVAHGVERQVSFHGSLPSEERDDIVRSAWMTVAPSAAEGWGIVVIEANALGRPAIAFRVPGLSDSIRPGETGWLVDDDDALGSRMADALEMLRSPDVAARWSHRTVTWAARCDWDDTTEIIEHALRSEAARRARANRRAPTDLASHIFVPSATAGAGWDPTFRLTDRCLQTNEGWVILLPGTDLNDARVALRRTGIPPEALADAALRIRVARPSDFIDPAAGAELVSRENRRPPCLALVHEAVAPASWPR